jgi:hypothetical protein
MQKTTYKAPYTEGNNTVYHCIKYQSSTTITLEEEAFLSSAKVISSYFFQCKQFYHQHFYIFKLM